MAVNCRKTCNICYIDTYAKNTKPQSTASRKPQYSSIQTTEGCFNLFPGNICQSMKEKQWCIKFEDALRGVCAKTCKLCTRSQSTNSNTKSTTTTSTTTTTTAPRESSLEACRTGDPYGCPRRSCDCTSIEIFRRCPNICENCGMLYANLVSHITIFIGTRVNEFLEEIVMLNSLHRFFISLVQSISQQWNETTCFAHGKRTTMVHMQ